MNNVLIKQRRKSHAALGEIYFWTATINGWKYLLKEDSFKDVIISSWQYLSDQEKLYVFAFVIMPNHLHAILRANELNGKESSQGSFLKYTAHVFQEMLRKEKRNRLRLYEVNACNKKYEFWQRDPLAIPLHNREVARQKLNYAYSSVQCHFNALILTLLKLTALPWSCNKI